MGLLQQLFGTESTETSKDEIRGWSVVDDTGRDIGRVDDLMVDPDSNQVRYAIIRIENRRVLVPISAITMDENRHTVAATGYSRDRLLRLREYNPTTWNDQEERMHFRDLNPNWKETDRLDYNTDRFRGHLPKRIQLLEEELKVGKRRVKTGEVTIGKRPITEQVRENVSLERERLNIERHPVNREVTGREISGEAETIKVPLYAEEPVVNKQTFVREEVEVNKVPERREETVRDQVKREELVTEGLDKTQRELTFSGTEPTAEERLRRDRAKREKPDVEVIPTDIDKNQPL